MEGPTLRVLIVDDEPRLRALLERAAASWGHRAEAVGSAEAALRAIEQQPPDVLVLDLNLPAMQGMELFETLRERGTAAQVIILTGFGDLDDARRAIRLEAADFLRKPCRMAEFEAALGRAQRRLLAPSEPPPAADPGDETPGADAPLADVEWWHIQRALDRHAGNRAAAAADLGISVRTLYNRLRDHADEA